MQMVVSELSKNQYIGRFAPSPSGELHFGSLVAALGSFLDARSNEGRWLVRIDDIDPPREVPGAADSILKTLEHYGLFWDGEVAYQSQHQHRYIEIIEQLIQRGETLYFCCCTRKRIKELGGFYDGFCRDKQDHQLSALCFTDLNLLNNSKLSIDRQNQDLSNAEELVQALDHRAIRLQQRHPIYSFDDELQGNYVVPAELAEEDMALIRRDGLFSYNLATVVDDHDSGITHIVRGADLLAPTTRQIALYQALNWPIPRYRHLPVVMNEDGLKLSKQNHAPALPKGDPRPILLNALKFLGQNTQHYADKWPDLSLEQCLAVATKHLCLEETLVSAQG